MEKKRKSVFFRKIMQKLKQKKQIFSLNERKKKEHFYYHITFRFLCEYCREFTRQRANKQLNCCCKATITRHKVFIKSNL